jgi:hypothetical protein
MIKAISTRVARLSIAKRYCLPTLDSSALRTIGSRGPLDLVKVILTRSPYRPIGKVVLDELGTWFGSQSEVLHHEVNGRDLYLCRYIGFAIEIGSNAKTSCQLSAKDQ